MNTRINITMYPIFIITSQHLKLKPRIMNFVTCETLNRGSQIFIEKEKESDEDKHQKHILL